MARVGGDGHDFPFVSVEREGIEAGLFIPEGLIELLHQPCRLEAKVIRTIGLAEVIADVRHAEPRVIDVALKFAESLRSLDQGAVYVDDSFP